MSGDLGRVMPVGKGLLAHPQRLVVVLVVKHLTDSEEWEVGWLYTCSGDWLGGGCSLVISWW